MFRVPVIVLFLVFLKNVGATDVADIITGGEEKENENKTPVSPVTEELTTEEDPLVDGPAEAVETNLSAADLHDSMLAALNNMAEAERTIKEAEKQKQLTQEEEYGKIFGSMASTFQDFIDLVKDPQSALAVLNSNGFEEFILPNLRIENFGVRKQILILIKNLFDIDYETTVSVIPIEIVDKLIDIFELDESLAIKEYVLDVLNAWLPGNPKVQARVIIYKGLEPFYYQVYTLQPDSIYVLLDLFNKILREHKAVRSQTIQSSKEELDKLRLYQRIGLLERIKSPEICDGILKIFETVWVYHTKENNILIPVFELMEHVKDSCIETFKVKPNAIGIFGEIEKYIAEPENRAHYEQERFNVDMNKVQKTVDDYMEQLKAHKERTEL